ncbi:MAG TPA: tRNA guanosine(34) transglycosylase Tgt [Bacteroidia bacterium]|nr:tRNA guanosine(34) transglycosylase Tgt [Bacteroidia bacterium]
MRFRLEAVDTGSHARAGVITTDHGEIQTPVFMPVGTAGSVKSVHQRELVADVKAKIILGNTYHLNLRPGMDVIAQAGGLHNFMGWELPLLTDSGGYQVFSLAEKRKIKEEGAWFRSHIDGSSHFLSPETSIDIQRTIGADIIMAFDECTPWPCDHRTAKKSMDLTHRWLKRSCEHFDNTETRYGHSQTLFPIVQGSTFKDLRIESAETIAACEREGNAIGGLSVGEPAEEMYETTERVCAILPADKPRYLMGVGTPANLLECIALGIDMFDCVMPTRNARNGMLFTQEGIINIRNEKWKSDFTPIDPAGPCFVDAAYSKAYLRHLVISKEILAAQIATLHNLSFYVWLMGEARRHIQSGDYAIWKNVMVKKLAHRL